MTRVEDVTGRLWREYAEIRRRLSAAGSAKIPREVFGDDRHDHQLWNRITGERHQRYRDRVEVPDEPTAILCVTNRPDRLPDIRANVTRQLHQPLELVLVLNYEAFNAAEVRATTRAISRAGIQVEVFERPDLTLGACLNLALAATESRFVAKFDDDDRYGAAYLPDALRAHTYSGAGVVGKHTHFVLLKASPTTCAVPRQRIHLYGYPRGRHSGDRPQTNRFDSIPRRVVRRRPGFPRPLSS